MLILADDLDWKLWREIPRLHALEQAGSVLSDYVVSDSLCCPSRTTIFRGQYVHNHQVVSNDARRGGGWVAFRDRGYPRNSLGPWLHQAGIRTGLIGKFLNGYPDSPTEQTQAQPGWDTFIVPISRLNEYNGYDYTLNDNGTLEPHGHDSTDFLNDVLDTKAEAFITSGRSPFFLELASFTPHLPAPVAPRHLGSHTGDSAPRDQSFGAAVFDPPSWLRGLPPLTSRSMHHMDRLWQKRAESAESVADSVDAVHAALMRSGHLNDTLVIVTSDNGFHVGSYRTHWGKRTAFDTDVVVPAVLIGPGIPAGRVIDAVTSETDIAPTVLAVYGREPPEWFDGRSWLPLLAKSSRTSSQDPIWRTGTISESLDAPQPGDPDYELIQPATFIALRTHHWLFVRSTAGEEELYDRLADPMEIRNVINETPTRIVTALRQQLLALHRCAGRGCRYADSRPEPV